jgi:[ribosomal protein S5]-alanine N-acetyltransferase
MINFFFPEFQLEQLLLRIPRVSDAQKMLDFYHLNSSFFAPTDPPKPETFLTLPYWKEMIQRYQNNWIERNQLRLILICKESGEVAGTISFTQMERGPFQCCKLGYKLGEKFTGKGLMTNSLKLSIEYIFDELNFHRIEASYVTTNTASANVLQRLDFTVDGTANNYLMIGGVWRDHILTSLTNNNWKEMCL